MNADYKHLSAINKFLHTVLKQHEATVRSQITCFLTESASASLENHDSTKRNKRTWSVMWAFLFLLRCFKVVFVPQILLNALRKYSVVLARYRIWRTCCQSRKNISRLSHISLWKARTVLATTLFLFSFYCSGTNFITVGASGNNTVNFCCLSTELLDILSSHQGGNVTDVIHFSLQMMWHFISSFHVQPPWVDVWK